MLSTAYAETLFFKKLKNTSQKSTPFIWDCYSSKTSLFKVQSGFEQEWNSFLAYFVLLAHFECAGSPVWIPRLVIIQDQSWPKHLVSLFNDGCIGGDPQYVVTSATMIRNAGLFSIGLEINNSKCELLLLSTTQTPTSPKQASFFKTNSHTSLPDPPHSFIIDSYELLGSSLYQESTPLHLNKNQSAWQHYWKEVSILPLILWRLQISWSYCLCHHSDAIRIKRLVCNAITESVCCSYSVVVMLYV